MGSEMQERVARAIYDAPTKFDGDQIAVHLSLSMHVEGSATDADHLRSIVMSMCMDAALAAMEAMREPTEEMVDAADDPFHVAWRESNEFADRDGLARGHASAQFSKPMYRAMLDAEIEAAKKGL